MELKDNQLYPQCQIKNPQAGGYNNITYLDILQTLSVYLLVYQIGNPF